MLRSVLTLVLMTVVIPAYADAALRPDALVFNQTYVLEAGLTPTFPLYLSRRGDYYAEAILERAEGEARPPLAALGVNVQVDLGDKQLLVRDVSTAVGRERPTATLFWLTTDRELPLRQVLALAVRFDAVAPALLGQTLRIQIKRKLNPGRWR